MLLVLPSVYQAPVEEPGQYIYPLEEEWVLTAQPHLHSQPALEISLPYQQHLSKPENRNKHLQLHLHFQLIIVKSGKSTLINNLTIIHSYM